MASSMTGYGRGRRGPVEVELRSVNHRHQDVRVHLPGPTEGFSAEVEAAVRAAFGRGRLEVRVTVESASGTELDVERARHFVSEARELAAALGLSGEVDLHQVIAAPGVMRRARLPEDGLRKDLHAALAEAIEACRQMRGREGAALCEGLLQRVLEAEKWAAAIGRRSPIAIQDRRARIQRRLEEVLGEGEGERARVAQEVALLLDKLDLSEELDRLRAHFDRFRELLADETQPAGRKLDFLLQEMNREANTAGSKASDTEIAHAVVELKAELERMREQTQNIE